MAIPRRSRLLARRQPADTDGTMSLVEHLRELRNRIGLALIGILLGMVAAFIWYDNGLLQFLIRPYCGLDPSLRISVNTTEDCQLLTFDVLGQFMLRLKVAFIVGMVLAAPWWLYQLWAFITPGLKRNEKRYAITFVVISSFLFIAGAAMAYLTLSAGLRLLLSIGGEEITAALGAAEYISFLSALLLAFGVSFELPLVAVMLNIVGILSHELLRRSRRWIIFLTFVFAAFVTPTQDPFTMLAMAVPMCILFEGAIQFCRFNDKRRAARDAELGFHHIDDDEASPLDASPSPLADEPLDDAKT